MQDQSSNNQDHEYEYDLGLIEVLPEHDPTEHLDTIEAIAVFLNEFINESDPAVLLYGLNIAARARGMTQIANDTGLSREALYKALRPIGKKAPRLDTVISVIKALGVRLTVEPAGKPREARDVTLQLGTGVKHVTRKVYKNRRSPRTSSEADKGAESTSAPTLFR